MKIARIAVLMILGLSLLMAGGCRRRIAKEEIPDVDLPAQQEAQATEAPTRQAAEIRAAETPPPSEEPVREAVPTEQAEQMSEQEAVEAETDDEAALVAEVAEPEAPAMHSMPSEQGETAVAVPEIEAMDSLTETVLAEQESETNPSDEGNAVGIIIDANAQFLRAGLGALYECERGYVYFEMAQAFETVSRASEVHALIVEAGGYNVAERLAGAAPVAEADWVVRKNPNVIVKCVGSLGAGVTSTAAARAEMAELSGRPGWDGVSAVVNRTMVMISSELLETAEGRLLAKLYIAEAMYPVLFADTSIAEIARAMAEAGGKRFDDGVYVYSTSQGLAP